MTAGRSILSMRYAGYLLSLSGPFFYLYGYIGYRKISLITDLVNTLSTLECCLESHVKLSQICQCALANIY